MKRCGVKNFALINILLLLLVQASAQIKSSHDGFYTLDSVFYQLSGKDSFKYCVNCYSPDSLRAYNEGVWLYSREHAPNTWENSRFSKGTSLNFQDTTDNYKRADVVKANTIWVRIYHDTGYTDQHHLVFLGNWRPKTTNVISLFLDSADFMGPKGFYGPGEGKMDEFKFKWNYRLKIEKECSYQVFGGKQLQLEAEQTAGVEISAHASADFPNKPMQLNAYYRADKSKMLLLGASLTGALGQNINVLRFRLGGPNHRSNILMNEIALDIMQPELGGEPSVPVCLFVNGSFWTYAFAEEGMGPNHISKVMKTYRKNLVSAKVEGDYPIAGLKKLGFTITPLGHSMYSLTRNSINLVYYVHKDSAQLPIDTLDEGYNPLAFEALGNAVDFDTDSLLASTIDRVSLFRYALSIWFFQNTDAYANSRLTIAKAGANKWSLFAEHYDFNPGSPMANDWDKFVVNDAWLHQGKLAQSLPRRATMRMIKYDPAYFCLVLEDELNTTYKPERTVPLAQNKISSLRPCISECSKVWQPYGWLDSLSWESTITGITSFLADRPSGIAAAIPKNFMSGSDTLLTLKDMHSVTVKFDSVAGINVTVKLNSLDLKSNFSGNYYPKPDLRISLTYDSTKYKFVKWIEYPNSPVDLKLSADRSVTLTPILKARKD